LFFEDGREPSRPGQARPRPLGQGELGGGPDGVRRPRSAEAPVRLRPLAPAF